MADSPDSPLSSLSLEDDSSREDSTTTIKYDPQTQSPSTINMSVPASKRRRTGLTSWDCHTPLSSVQDDIAPPSSPSVSSISSDTSGEVPNSPGTMALLGANQDDDYSGQGTDQVTICRWEGCDAGDLGNMDGLVQHIRSEHVGGKHKKYLCEWADCSRKGQTHASGYALRAHMRSHTREKPFFCSLPECDRSFTRSDALTKHMRTVHEAEALRPSSDSLPKQGTGQTPNTKLQRIKLKISQPPKDAIETEQQQQQQQSQAQLQIQLRQDSHNQATPDATGTDDLNLPEYGPEIGFDEHELSLRPFDLYRLLRRQIHWAEQENDQLRSEWEQIQPKRKHAWREKEAIFDNVMEVQGRLYSAVVERREEMERERERELEKKREIEREMERERELEREKEGERQREEEEVAAASAPASQDIVGSHDNENNNENENENGDVGNVGGVNGVQSDEVHQQQQQQQHGHEGKQPQQQLKQGKEKENEKDRDGDESTKTNTETDTKTTAAAPFSEDVPT